MIEKFWYSNSYFKWLFYPLSLPFLFLTYLKYWLYKKRIVKINCFDKPVLVVGNINVGGTGKTPLIAWLVIHLRQENIRVGIVSRGYRSNLLSYPHLVKESDSVEEEKNVVIR